MANFSTIEIRPHEGDPYTVAASASLYKVEQNRNLPVLSETIRFRFDISTHTARLGDTVVYDEKEWILGMAQVSFGARRIMVDAHRQSLDTSQCQQAKIYQWQTEYDCNAGEDLVPVKEGVRVAPWHENISSVDLRGSRQSVDLYKVYLSQEDARDLSHLSVIRIGDLDLKVQKVNNLDTPGELAWVDAQDYNMTLASI